MTSSPVSLMFTRRRCQPQLVPPATPTPHEVKLPSDIDDQEGPRFQIPFINIYRQEPSMAGKDPDKVLRQALAQTLVYYYPFAGRLREGHGLKLMVDCTGEGVMFIEVDADVPLDQFGDDLQPPFSCFNKLLYDVPGSEHIINTPILLIQVTRLKCGGFIVALRLNHAMSDGGGVKQFLSTWAEIARGACQPSILPVWRRELLKARDPPRITCNHHEYEQVPNVKEGTTMIHQSFFFRATDISALRRLLPFHLRECTTFDVIAACYWCCRTKALQLEPEEEVRMLCVVNARTRLNPPLPVGYYGNSFVLPAAITTAGKLYGNPFGYAVELIRKAKNDVTEEYVHSVADLSVIKGRCSFINVRSCLVSDLTRAKLREVNFGWGKAVYGGLAKGGVGHFLGGTSLNPHKNAKGEEGVVLPICLPSKDMKRFAKELDEMLGNQNQPTTNNPSSIMSTL